ncbi:MAG: hypothetical protein HGA85_05100, partial [Nanoarchaeota archaeon]|nr:hypothetical protein [Nanoarchaeota archaeon]
HTGMYVGRGKLSEPKAYWGKNCYLKYTPDPNGEPIFIHSIGNSNYKLDKPGSGQPGTCLETYNGLLASGPVQLITYCRPNKCK